VLENRLVEKSADSCNVPHFGLQIRFQLKSEAVEKSAARCNVPHFGLQNSVFNAHTQDAYHHISINI
jgi:hypothetical protein